MSVTKVLVLSNKLTKVELSPWKLGLADVLGDSTSPFALTKGPTLNVPNLSRFIIRASSTRFDKANVTKFCFTVPLEAVPQFISKLEICFEC